MNIIILLLFILLIITIIGNTYVRYQKIKLEELKLYESINFDSKYDLLNKIILEEVDDYKVLNFTYKEDELYINQEMQKEMINVVTTKVFERITDAIKENLKLIYRIRSDEDLINIIGKLVSMKVLEYSIEINVVDDE